MKAEIYKVGIYCRLSVDDASSSAKAGNYIPADESVSIENQKELLSKFVMLNGWVETRTYVDDGFSGGNFQRPGFLDMLEDARKGIINLILVKDLSRLGRDYVEVGRYTDIVFPSLGCRFVSVLDCLDSEGDNTDMLHFRSLMNDYHLRDLSTKIKSVIHNKKINGQYLGSMAPFGYAKSAEDSHRLVIDEYAAGIVRRIFDMRLSGTAYSRIVASLNRENIPSPRFYWYQNHSGDTGKVKRMWTTAMVKIILNNEVYCGILRMNYKGTRSYKDRTMVAKPEAEWIRHEGLHEAIVSPEVWNTVQKLNDETRRRFENRQPPCPKLFSGKLVCADCKSSLATITSKHRLRNGCEHSYISYVCSTHMQSGQTSCSWHRVNERTLAQIVTAEIRSHAQAIALDESAVVDKLRHRLEQYDMQRFASAQQEIRQLRLRVEKLTEITAKLYEDKISGAISEDTFVVLMQKNEQVRQAGAERLNVLLSETEQAEQETAAVLNWTALVRKHLNLDILDRAVIDELIDHIEIGERTIVDGAMQQDIKIFYRFVGFVG